MNLTELREEVRKEFDLFYGKIQQYIEETIRHEMASKPAEVTHDFSNAEMRPLHRALRDRIMALDPDMECEPTKYYVGYKVPGRMRRMFVSIRPRKNALIARIDIPTDEVETLLETRDRTELVNKSMFTDVRISSHTQIDSLMEVIRQAYNRNCRK